MKTNPFRIQENDWEAGTAGVMLSQAQVKPWAELPVPDNPASQLWTDTNHPKMKTWAVKKPKCVLLRATHGTLGILDSGASKTVIGSSQLSSLIRSFEPSLRSQLRRGPCNITFRFGNQGTLQSKEALIAPLGPLQLRIAIVSGGTPFLLSNTLLRALKAKIDCMDQILTSPLLAEPVQLQLSSRGLFLVDLNELALQARRTIVAQPNEVPETLQSMTFVSEDQEKFSAAATVPESAPSTDQQDESQVKGDNQVSVPPTTECQSQPDDSEHKACPHQHPVQESATSKSKIDQCQNVAIRAGPASEESSDTSAGGSGRPQSLDSGGPHERDHRLWLQAQGQDICRSLDGSRLGELHGHPLSREHQACPSKVPSLCGVETGSTRAATSGNPSHPSRQCASGNAHPHSQSQGNGQGKARSLGHINVPPRHGGRMGHGTRSVSLSDYDLKLGESGSPCFAGEDAQSGECPDACGSSPREPGQCSPSPRADDLRHRLSADWTAEINTLISQEHQNLKRLIHRYEDELQQAIRDNRPIGKPCALLEVFCSENSPLTHQMLQQKESAYRFGYAQGNLVSQVGRAKLFGMVARHQPTDIWVSPDCGPWSSWSQLNASRSLEHQQWYETIRNNLLFQIAICIVLFRYQIMNDRHFHWEQPAKSLMFAHPGLAEVHQHTHACQFDMCMVGELKDPQNGLPIKKGMTVLTTRQHVYKHLHGIVCNKQHQHQPLEGSVQTDQGIMLRTQFSAVYPRKFARTIVRLILQDTTSVLAAMTRRARPKFVRSELVSPVSQPEPDAKRRRLDGKQFVPQSLDRFQMLMKSIENKLKRVGKQEITDENTRQLIQELLPDKRVIRVVACRGTDRTIGPPDNLQKDEAPFRRTIMLHRPSQEIKYEKYWEKWSELSNRQLIRPAHPCRINITVFACDHDSSASSSERPQVTDELPVPQVSPADDHPGTVTTVTPPPVRDTTTEVKASGSETTGPASNDPYAEQTFRFRSLPKWEQRQIIHMHKNLGHPSNERLSRALQQAGYRPDVSQAALELKCAVCSKCAPPKHQRPSTLKPMLDFNHRVYIDGVNWTNAQGKTLQFYHIIDAGSNFHVAIAAPAKTTQDIVNLITQHWISWAGPPTEIQVDSGTELNSEEFAVFLQRLS